MSDDELNDDTRKIQQGDVSYLTYELDNVYIKVGKEAKYISKGRKIYARL